MYFCNRTLAVLYIYSCLIFDEVTGPIDDILICLFLFNTVFITSFFTSFIV